MGGGSCPAGAGGGIEADGGGGCPAGARQVPLPQWQPPLKWDSFQW